MRRRLWWMAPNDRVGRRRFMLGESPTRYVIPPAYARGLPTAAAPAPLRASRAVASRPLRDRAAPSLHALHYASGVRAYGAHLDYPRAPQRPRHAVPFDRLRAPRVTSFAETARPPKLATLEGCLRLRGSGGEAPPDRCAYGFIERGGPCHRRGQAAPSGTGDVPPCATAPSADYS